MTLREFLQQHQDRAFILRGAVVDAQAVCNHYSFALDALVECNGGLLQFVRSDRSLIMFTAAALIPDEAA